MLPQGAGGIGAACRPRHLYFDVDGGRGAPHLVPVEGGPRLAGHGRRSLGRL